MKSVMEVVKSVEKELVSLGLETITQTKESKYKVNWNVFDATENNLYYELKEEVMFDGSLDYVDYVKVTVPISSLSKEAKKKLFVL